MAEGDCLQVVLLNSELKEIAPKVARVLFDLGVGWRCVLDGDW